MKETVHRFETPKETWPEHRRNDEADFWENKYAELEIPTKEIVSYLKSEFALGRYPVPEQYVATAEKVLKDDPFVCANPSCGCVEE